MQFSRQVDDVGEYLADVSALEAAGVDSIWLDGRSGQDPWMQLAAIAAVTGRVRLAISIDPPPVDQRSLEVLSQRVITLQRLSRARAIVRIGEGAEALDDVIDLVRRASGESAAIFLALETAAEHGYRRVAQWADGFVHPGATATASTAFRRVLELRQRERANAPPPLELWTRVDVPDTREGWKAARRACEDAGATGAIVPFGPRLLDMLRRPDEEDDRSDLLVAQG